MRVLGVVTARGGSKGVPRKNIRLLGGKPLIAWTAEAALGAKRLARTVVSTDDEEIAQVSRAAGLDVPFLRPPELALDTTPSLPVVQHAVRTLEAMGDRYDAICLLQPTSPLRSAAMIDACLALLESSGADSAVTVLPIPHDQHPYWAYVAAPNGDLRLALGGAAPATRRQDLPPAFFREGSVYTVRRDVLLDGESLYGARTVGHVIEAAQSVNIDTLEDWARAEAAVAAICATRPPGSALSGS
ncbi:MAG: acylneuraminate cytidylyltransferase family protein [Myxococcales bacterium]|nr:acylneuraminate cytidylyltransferase family protein [Myxococcales bacterium]